MYSKPSPSKSTRSTPARATRSRRGTTPLADAPAASGSRQLRNTRGKLESNPQGNDGAALPSVQGAFSSSYGAPGMADLPDMLFHNPTQTLAETIDAGLQDSNARASALVNDFQREFTGSPSSESHVSQEANPNRSTASAPASRALSDTTARTRPLPPLFEDEEQDEQEDDEEEEDEDEDEQEQEELDEQGTRSGLPTKGTAGTRPSSSSGNGTISFIRERVTHATTVPVGSTRARERRNSANVHTGNSYILSHALAITLLVLALLIVIATILGGEKSAVACRRIPVFSRFCSDFAFHHNPYLFTRDKQVAQRTLDNFILMEANTKALDEKVDGFSKYMDYQGSWNEAQTNINKGLVESVDTLNAQHRRLFRLWGYLNSTNVGPGEWYYDQINHFDPGNGAVVLPGATSATFTAITSPWHAIVNWFLGRHRPRSPGAAISGWARAGDCWCANIVERNQGWGQLGVRVLKEIWPTSLVLDHLPKSASLNPSATPKDVELWAYIPSEKGQSTIRNLPHFAALNTEPDNFFPAEWVRIKNATYNIDSFHVQFFDIPYPRFEETAAKDFVVRATSNYGKEKYTCFYSVILRGEVVFPLEAGEVEADL